MFELKHFVNSHDFIVNAWAVTLQCQNASDIVAWLIITETGYKDKDKIDSISTLTVDKMITLEKAMNPFINKIRQ